MSKRKIVFTSIIAVFVVSVAMSIASFAVVSARSVPAWGEVAVESGYEYGTTFNIPERKIVVGGKYRNVTAILRFPDGTETKESSVKLDQAGIYKLRFIAQADGNVYLDEKEFKVTAKYAIVGDKSTVEYISTSKKPNSGALYVRLAAGETLEFSEPIDIKDATKSDNIIELMAIPDKIGNQDFEKITVRLTDVHDSSVYVEIISYAYGGVLNGCRAYVLSHGNGQTPKGYYHSGSSLTLNSNVSGTSAAHCFYGWTNDDGTQQYSSLRLAFDYENNAVYANDRLNIDLDSTDCFPEYLWSGFTGSKVKVSVSCDTYSAATANFEIYSVYGMDLSKSLYKDEVAPQITVDADADDMPYAEAGKTYGVPDAYAFDDVCGYLDAVCKVYYNYNSENPVSVAVENGRFATRYVGWYTIVYSATDYSGNKAEKTLWVNSLTDAEDPTITIDESSKKTSAYVGETYTVAEVACYGGSGKLVCNVYAEKDGNRTIVEDNEFVPETAGSYKIIYEVTDEIGQTVNAEYGFTVSVASSPVFRKDVLLPSVLIVGGNYEIPTVYAYDYSDGTKKDVAATCVVADKNGSATYNAGDVYVPAIDGKNGTVTFKFVAGTAERSYEVPCVDVWNVIGNRKRLDFAAYMYSEDGVVTEKTKDGLKVTVNGDGTAEFINPLLADKFSVTLRGSDGFGKIAVTLTDDQDEKVKITFVLEEKNGKVYLSSNGTTITPEFSFDGERNIEIGYSNGKLTAAGLTINVEKTDDGKTFEGFKSHKVRMSFSFSTAEEKSVYIEKIVNHSFAVTLSSDGTEPAYYVPTTAGGTIAPGKTTIYAAYAADVLDPNALFTMSVVDSDGNYLSDVNGVLLKDVDPSRDYTVNFDKLGEYAVKYFVSDVFNSSANTASYSVSYKVLDEVAPVIKFSGEFKTEIKVGEIYSLPSVKVSDNYSENDKIQFMKYFSDPSGRMNEISSDSNSFKATIAGKYTLYYMAVDEAGNVGYFTVDVIAK